jgi:uncharacterized protein
LYALHDPLFLLVAFLGVSLAGLSKGGFAGAGILATPLMALAIPPVEAAAIMLPILIIQDAFSLWAYRGSIDWRNISILLPGAIGGILLGYLLAAYLSEDITGGAIGIIATVFSLRSLLSKSAADAPPKKATVPDGLFWGALSGFTSMILHAGGPPFQIYVQPQKLSRDLFIGTSVLYFAVVNWIKVPPYLMLGELNMDTFKVSLVLAPLAIVTTFVGIRIVRYFSTEMFYKIINVLLLFVGLKLVWSAAHSLFFAG